MPSHDYPLRGVRVVELGSSVAAPSAGRLLADLGADVYKIEPPDGDALRTWGAMSPDGTSWWFKAHNRNKQFLTFDLHAEADRETVRSLVTKCDVLLENFRPGRLSAWGLGYDDLRDRAPHLVYVSISGFGQDGPYADRAGFGNVAEAMSGIRHITGDPNGPPMRMGLSIGDELAGLYAVVGTLAALRARERTGRGDWVDVSLFESCFSLLEGVVPEYGALGLVRERQGNRYASAAPSGVYPTRDGRYIAIGANNDAIFRRFCVAAQRPHLASDPRFANNPARMANVEALDDEIAAWTVQHDVSDLLDIFRGATVPAGAVASIAEIAADPHVLARELIVHAPDDRGERIAMAAVTPRFKHHPGRLDRAAGAIGRDTAAVLETFGISR